MSITLLLCTGALIAYFSFNKSGRKFVGDQIQRIERESYDLTNLLSTAKVNLTDLKNDNDQLKQRIKEMRDLIHAKTHILGDLRGGGCLG